ncbi:MAG: U32 family peptidase [Planctomycetales bacterium]|nr:U32 family peptidase [Planctomycetales bacterium]
MSDDMPGLNRLAAPELLAPAGDWDCARAAIENGADAIYFGLDAGFNARYRATNFSLESLPELMATLHRRGVLGYVTLNTLAFTDELPQLEEHVRQLAAAGVDAVLVQDLGLARMIRAICPALPIHASTQMTMTAAATIAEIKQLGVSRVVLARELSLAEIRKIAAAAPMPLEAFVHGALCVAYSGQCLTSESLGGRSANRGHCAQACRLDYQLICDGEDVDLGDVKYLLSPQDLAAIELVPELVAAGIASLKIEGRLKSPEYVAAITANYRRAIDDAMRGAAVHPSPAARREMELTFSRGLAPGWLAGNDHKRLVPGLNSAKRGLLVGEVRGRRGDRLVVALTQPLAKGDGIVLDGNRAAGEEIGGRVYQVFLHGEPQEEPVAGAVELLLPPGLLDGARTYAGQLIWQTDDPRLIKRLRASYSGADPARRMAVDVQVRAVVGEPLTLRATCEDGVAAEVAHEHRPEAARNRPTDATLLREQLARLGGTPYELRTLAAEIVGEPMIPLSVLGQLRKQMIAALDEARIAPAERPCAEPGVAQRMMAAAQANLSPVATEASRADSPRSGRDDNQLEAAPNQTTLHVLCRSLKQLLAAIEAGATQLYADFHDLREYKSAVTAAHDAGATIYLASLRIHKPGEDGLFVALEKAAADGWLVRNLAALAAARQRGIAAIADFSLNAANPLTVEWLREQGAARVTASYDLNRDQLLELAAAAPPRDLEVVVHQHMPMFHMEHCVFCAVLSPGRNKTDCGRPCDRHEVKLRDRVGAEHVLHADIGCRNTLYNAAAQSGAEAVRPLMEQGVRHFRVELLADAPTRETRRLIGLYQRLLTGEIDGREVWQSLRAESRVGVTRGTLEHPRNPLAIL